MEPLVTVGDAGREGTHRTGIDDVEFDGLHGAFSEGAGLAGRGLNPLPVPPDEPERGAQTCQFQCSRLTDSR